MVNSISIALSGLEAASKKVSASASNIANLQTTGSLDESGQAPYTPVTTQNESAANGQGVNANLVARNNPFVPAFDPDSPFADENGIIGVPNINLAEEVVNLTLAKLQFKANIATLQTAQELSEELLNIFDDEA